MFHDGTRSSRVAPVLLQHSDPGYTPSRTGRIGSLVGDHQDRDPPDVSIAATATLSTKRSRRKSRQRPKKERESRGKRGKNDSENIGGWPSGAKYSLPPPIQLLQKIFYTNPK